MPHQPRFPTPTDRARTTPRRWRTNAALAFALWTGIGLLLAVQGYFLWLGEVTLIDAIQAALPRSYVWGLLAPLVFAADHRVLGRLSPARRIAAHVPVGMLFTLLALASEYTVLKVFQVGDYVVMLTDGTALKIGRMYRSRLEERLNQRL